MEYEALDCEGPSINQLDHQRYVSEYLPVGTLLSKTNGLNYVNLNYIKICNLHFAIHCCIDFL